MAWVLGGVTLKKPQSFGIDEIENSVEHTTLDNTLKKQIRGRKRKYILGFKALTRTQFNTLFDIIDDNTTKSFAVTDGSLSISATVQQKITRRTFSYKGSEFREDLTLELTEV